MTTPNAGPDVTVPAGTSVTLTGTPPGGGWSQDSGPPAAMSTPITTSTDTRVVVQATNTSTTTNAVREFRYSIVTGVPGAPVLTLTEV